MLVILILEMLIVVGNKVFKIIVKGFEKVKEIGEMIIDFIKGYIDLVVRVI